MAGAGECGELRHLRHQGPRDLEFLVGWLSLLHECMQMAYQACHDLSEANVLDLGIRPECLLGECIANLAFTRFRAHYCCIEVDRVGVAWLGCFGHLLCSVFRMLARLSPKHRAFVE